MSDTSGIICGLLHSSAQYIDKRITSKTTTRESVSRLCCYHIIIIK